MRDGGEHGCEVPGAARPSASDGCWGQQHRHVAAQTRAPGKVMVVCENLMHYILSLGE